MRTSRLRLSLGHAVRVRMAGGAVIGVAAYAASSVGAYIFDNETGGDFGYALSSLLLFLVLAAISGAIGGGAVALAAWALGGAFMRGKSKLVAEVVAVALPAGLLGGLFLIAYPVAFGADGQESWMFAAVGILGGVATTVVAYATRHRSR